MSNSNGVYNLGLMFETCSTSEQAEAKNTIQLPHLNEMIG